MHDLAVIHAGTLSASVALAALILVQFVVLDVAGIRARHVPGTPVGGGHDNFLFRAARAHANTNENIGLHLLLILCALMLSADPRWTAIAAWTFTAARAAHMLCYYADWRSARSIAFGAGLLAQAALLLLCLLALFGRGAG